MKQRLSVLVVCTGNICRSPTGEGVLRALAERHGLGDRLQVRSAGTHDYHVGECPDPRAMKHALQRGYDLSAQRAMHLAPRHFHEYDYLLAMDADHLRILRAMAPEGATAYVGLFMEASARWRGEEVPDPYYGGPDGFERVLDMIEEAAQRWVERFAAHLAPADPRPQEPR